MSDMLWVTLRHRDLVRPTCSATAKLLPCMACQWLPDRMASHPAQAHETASTNQCCSAGVRLGWSTRPVTGGTGIPPWEPAAGLSNEGPWRGMLGVDDLAAERVALYKECMKRGRRNDLRSPYDEAFMTGSSQMFGMDDLARATGCHPQQPNQAAKAVLKILPAIRVGRVSEEAFYDALYRATGEKVWPNCTLALAITSAVSGGRFSPREMEEVERLTLNYIDKVLRERKYNPRGGASLRTYVSKIIKRRHRDQLQRLQRTMPSDPKDLDRRFAEGGEAATDDLLVDIELERWLRPVTVDYLRIEVHEAAAIKVLARHVENAPARTSSIRRAYHRNLTILADVARRSDIVVQIVQIRGFEIPTCFHIRAEDARKHYDYSNATALCKEVRTFLLAKITEILTCGGPAADKLRKDLQNVLMIRSKAWQRIVRKFGEEEWGNFVVQESTWTAKYPASRAGSLVFSMVAPEVVSQILHAHEPLNGDDSPQLVQKADPSV